ncbi:MAG: hypothetical protein IJV71_12120 [Lachnospiraceae bacterium]|nr:hypothetical protein [Lachnospiraceae bacterium]
MGEKRLRDKSWEDYSISKYRYQELKNFCLQYKEKLEKIQYGLSAYHMDGNGGGAGQSDPTSQSALIHAIYKKDVDMIEHSAVEANPDIYMYILRSVTEDKSYEEIEYDETYGRIPCGKTDFYAYRRLFFSILDQKKRNF